MGNRTHISFDWAMKKLLRQKSNFIILEGFLTALFKEDIMILDILESESNKNIEDDKYNKVDLLAKNSGEEKILIEVQYDGALDYFQRMLYGSSKLVIDHLGEGMDYEMIRKVYSVHIVYFELGQGDDYVYHGTTRFVGLHNDQELLLNAAQKKSFLKEYAKDLFPEYYILRVNFFNEMISTPLDEWIHFFKTDFIDENTTTKGLPEAREQMLYSRLSKEERAQYDKYIDLKRLRHSEFKTKYLEGFDQGLMVGIEKGIEKGREQGEKDQAIRIAIAMKQHGMTDQEVLVCTGLLLEDIRNV